MGTDETAAVVALLSLTLLTVGCIGSEGEDVEANSLETPVDVSMRADEPGGVSNLGLELDDVLVHDANVSLPEGYHGLDVATAHAELVTDGEVQSVQLATGTLPAGTYDQVLVRLSNATAESGSDGGHDHGDGSDGHDHGGDSASTVSTGPVDVPVNVSFEVPPGVDTSVSIELDVDDSVSADGFSPVFSAVEVVQGNETVATRTDLSTPVNAGGTNATVPDDPPATRVAVFAPNGDQVYAPAFDPEDGAFANELSSGFEVGEPVRFTGTESEAVAEGAAVESYEWDFGDGNTSTGATARHAYEQPGVYEVTLTAEDSFGNEASHTVRVVTVGWTRTAASTSFEDGTGDWTQSADLTGLTTWSLDGEGFQSSTGWLVDADELPTPYHPGAFATLHSPTIQIPEDYVIAGLQVHVRGETATGELTVDRYVVDGGETQVAAFSDNVSEWTTVGNLRSLNDVAGEEVQLNFTFSAPLAGVPEGTGWLVDGFTVGGLATEDMVNHELLPDGDGHGGHDHSHG